MSLCTGSFIGVSIWNTGCTLPVVVSYPLCVVILHLKRSRLLSKLALDTTHTRPETFGFAQMSIDRETVSRRVVGAPGARADLDTLAAIHTLVTRFYAKVLRDPVLQRVFDPVLLDRHLPLIEAYWEKMLLHGTRYRRNMVRVHQQEHQKHGFLPGDFDRWLTLFVETVDQDFVGPKAERAKFLAHYIIGNLRRILLGSPQAV